MKPMERYKDAVMHRAKQKEQDRRRARKRLIAVCVPLCVCLIITGAVALPELLPVGTDYAEGTSCENLEATVSHGSSSWILPDADTLFLTLQSLCEPAVGGTLIPENATESVLNDGSDGNMTYGGAPETVGTTASDEHNENGSTYGYRITLSNGTSYLLTDNCLFADGECYRLTDDEWASLMALLEP